MFTWTPDLIQTLVQESTGIHADVFKRVNAAYPYGVRLWDEDTGNTLEVDSARASTTRSTQPEERRCPNAPNAPSPKSPSRPNRNEPLARQPPHVCDALACEQVRQGRWV